MNNTMSILRGQVLQWLGGWLLLLCMSMNAAVGETESKPLTVFAAISLTDVLTQAGEVFTRTQGMQVRFSFAASSVLAKQIEAGAPADCFIAADSDWMAYLQVRGLVRPATKIDVIGNRLVLIAPRDSTVTVNTQSAEQLLATLMAQTPLAIADPAVPAGRYAQAALVHLKIWPTPVPGVASRVVHTENVRAALLLVAHHEVPLGIVYASDAVVEPRVRVVARFPTDTYPAIIYPAAVVRQGNPAAQQFLLFLKSAVAQGLFKQYGFTPL